jgi:hypothetical protein
VAEGEEVLAINRFNRTNNASRRDRSLLDVVRSRWLHYMRRSVADGAISVGQPVRMKVRLLDRGAEDEKNGTEDGKHETRTGPRCRFLT